MRDLVGRHIGMGYWPGKGSQSTNYSALRNRLNSGDNFGPLARYFNVTFAIFAIVLTLTTIGICAVYTASAAIVGYRENLSRSRQIERSNLDAQEGMTSLRSTSAPVVPI